MRKIITGAVAAATIATSMVAFTAPADAQRWRGGGYRGGWHGGYGGYRGYRHGGVSTGTAVAAGLLGLGVGAAVASSSRPYYGGDSYYGGGYGYYDYPPPPPPVYYAPPPPPAYYGYYGW